MIYVNAKLFGSSVNYTNHTIISRARAACRYVCHYNAVNRTQVTRHLCWVGPWWVKDVVVINGVGCGPGLWWWRWWWCLCVCVGGGGRGALFALTNSWPDEYGKLGGMPFRLQDTMEHAHRPRILNLQSYYSGSLWLSFALDKKVGGKLFMYLVFWASVGFEVCQTLWKWRFFSTGLNPEINIMHTLCSMYQTNFLKEIEVRIILLSLLLFLLHTHQIAQSEWYVV